MGGGCKIGSGDGWGKRGTPKMAKGCGSSVVEYWGGSRNRCLPGQAMRKQGFLTLVFLYLNCIIYVHAHACAYLSVDNSEEVVLFFYHVGARH